MYFLSLTMVRRIKDVRRQGVTTPGADIVSTVMVKCILGTGITASIDINEVPIENFAGIQIRIIV